MRKFAFFCAIILVVVVALLCANDALNCYLVFSNENSNSYKIQRLFSPPENDEIPILGSSRAEAGFAPTEISKNAFNYGISGSPARETVFHLKEVLSRPGRTLVIVNLDPWGLGKGIFRGDYRFVADYPLVKSEPMIQVPIADRFLGFRFYGKTRSNLAECINSHIAATKTMERGAILQRFSRSKAEWKYIISKCEPQGFTCDEETKLMLTDTLMSNMRHEVVFVVSPIARPWVERFTGVENLVELEEWLSRFPHVHVIGFANTSEGYELSEFMDLTHLNEKGARRFSREIRERLVSLGLMQE